MADNHGPIARREGPLDCGLFFCYPKRMPRLPDDLQARAVEYLRNELHPDSLAYLREFHERYPDWNGDEVTPEQREAYVKEFGCSIPSPFHFGTGMAIRNVLRGEIKDAELPPVDYGEGDSYQNWDDYYQAVLDEVIAE
jgi:hypothetical protein